MRENAGQLYTPQEDVWVPSSCSLCYALCSIKVRRVNGTVRKIEGNPDSPIGQGRLCAKGAAGIMTLYDPNRINKPLMRTNPEKGIGVEPGWKEITWDEALDIIAERLKKIKEEDPRKLFFQFTTTCSDVISEALPFVSAFGTPNVWVAGGGLHCGNGAHFFGGLMHSSWSLVPDYEFCNYAIYFGASKGHAAGHAANAVAQQAADARARGMKLVVVDPMCNFASAKATEWVPIRVGTDAALALAMINVILNELGIWDTNYLKFKTNGPYLVKENGHFLRQEKSGKPLIWDTQEQKAKVYDDPTIKEFALEGSHNVGGIETWPAFHLLKEHVKKYSPEMASKITTVSNQDIRRLATEFAQEARIGSTILLDGVELPYRPVAAIFFRGAQGHKNCTFNCMAISLLNQIVGAADVPGGALGFNPVCYGFPETGQNRYGPREGPDGLIIPGIWRERHLPYPPARPTRPQTMGLIDLFSLAMLSFAMASADQEELWQKVDLPYRPEMLINFGANSVMSVGNASTVAETLKRIPFIVSFELCLTEFSDFADIVLPDTCYLERLDFCPHNQPIFNHPAGRGYWGWGIRQPVAEPMPGRRNFTEVLLELAGRIGIKDAVNMTYNINFDIKGPYRLNPEKNYTWEEIADRVLKSTFGETRGIAWFKENGIIKWPKQVKEVYWRPSVKVRVPIYLEFVKTIGKEIKELAEGYGIKADWAHYQALPDWIPCNSHKIDSSEYDLFAFYYRDTLHTNSFTMENPWLDEASRMDPNSYNVNLNADTAKKKGIKDGDWVWLESSAGRRVKGRARLSEGIHPEGAGIAACAGHWTPHQPIARGKGVFFNELLEINLENVDPVSLNLDLCAKVKVYKA